MFKNKILVKASPSSSSPLLLLPLSFPSSPESDPCLPSIELESLCWKLSRQWRLACILQSDQILLIYRKCQMELVDRVVSEFINLVPAISVGIEGEVKSGALSAKLIEIGLKCLMLGQNWSCIGDSTFVESSFGTDQERTDLCALIVEVQCGACDEFVFVVSPDTLRFSRHKISDLVNSKCMEIFENNKEVNFESYDYSTACMALPFLYEGYIGGLSKVLPEGECFDLIQHLWSNKHGLNLQSSYFIAVQYSGGGCMNKQWLPSSFVLQGSGLSAVPKSIRETKAKSAYESFIKILQAWDFFGDGPLTVTEQSVIGNGCAALPAWQKPTNNDMPAGITETDAICKDLLSFFDFRTSKPELGRTNVLNKEQSVFVSDGDSKDGSNDNAPSKEITLPVKEQVRLIVPSFSKNKRTNVPKRSRPKRSKEINNASQECNVTVGASKITTKHEKMNESLLTTSTSNSAECSAPTAKVADQPPMIKLMPSFTKNKKASTVQTAKIHPIAKTDASVKKNQIPKITATRTDAPVKKNQKPVKKNPNPKNKIMKNHLYKRALQNQIRLHEESSVQEGLSFPKSKDTKPKPKPKPKPKEKAKPSVNKEILDQQEKKSTDISMDDNSSESTATVQLQNGVAPVPVKKNPNQNPKKNEESGQPRATNPKPSLDKDEVTTKVINCHKRGQLQSLTVSDLRCFLSSKKAKVRGTKEELLSRATAFLD